MSFPASAFLFVFMFFGVLAMNAILPGLNGWGKALGAGLLGMVGAILAEKVAGKR